MSWGPGGANNAANENLKEKNMIKYDQKWFETCQYLFSLGYIYFPISLTKNN